MLDLLMRDLWAIAGAIRARVDIPDALCYTLVRCPL